MTEKQIDKFRKYLRENLSEGSTATYARAVGSALEKFPKDVVKFLLQSHLSNASRHTYWSALCHWATFIKDEELTKRLKSKELKRNFKDSLRSEHQQHEKHIVQPFSHEEEQRIFAVLQRWKRDTTLPAWQWPAISMMFSLGLRAGVDLAWLAHKDVESALKSKVNLVIVTKGSKERTVPAVLVLEELETLDEIEQKWDILADLISNGDDTTHRVRNAYERIRVCVKHLAKEAKIPPEELHTHRFRHNAAQRLYAETKDLIMVQKFLGHESSDTTQGYLKKDQTKETGDRLLAAMKRDLGGGK